MIAPAHRLRGERTRLVLLAVGVGGLHIAGLVLLATYAGEHPLLTGLGWTAYLLGLRHGFDADHIAAIDNTTRALMRRGQRPLAVGFFFALGHSTVVLALVAALAMATRSLDGGLGAFHGIGGVVGSAVAGGFLWLVGVLNLLVLVDLVRIARRPERGGADDGALEERLRRRGLVNRLVGRCAGALRSSWQMYPLGLLFALGFETASEVGLLALSAGTASSAVPLGAVLALPLLFTAGMTLVDTGDAVFMRHAYGRAMADPRRLLRYNIAVTAASVAVALAVGTAQLMHVAPLSGALAGVADRVDLETLGYLTVAVFVTLWATSYLRSSRATSATNERDTSATPVG